MKTANKCGRIGLFLSVLGIYAINLISLWPYKVVYFATTLCLLGLLVSLIGLIWKPRLAAVLGLLLGIFGSLCLPTVFLPVLLRR